MNTLFATILMALTVSTSSVSFASSKPFANQMHPQEVATPTVTFAQIVKSKLDVTVSKIADAPVIIRLFNSSGRFVAAKTLAKGHTDTRIRFDLTTLEDGVYHVSTYDGQNTRMQQFELKTTAPSPATYQDLEIL